MVREVVGGCKKVVQHDTGFFVLHGVVVWCGGCIEVLVEEGAVLLPPGAVRDGGEEPVPAHSGNESLHETSDAIGVDGAQLADHGPVWTGGIDAAPFVKEVSRDCERVENECGGTEELQIHEVACSAAG